MQDFIIGLSCNNVDRRHCWWGANPPWGWEDGKVLARCGACGHETLEWDTYDLFAYCGDRPYVYCDHCKGAFILCVNTAGDDDDKLHHDSCCRVLVAEDQHEIPNFERHVFREGVPLDMKFIACRALAITHVSPVQFTEKPWLVPKDADKLAALEGLDDGLDPQLVELREPVFNYGGQSYHLNYRGVCPSCHREVSSSVSAD
jgi:hypothetical protein